MAVRKSLAFTSAFALALLWVPPAAAAADGKALYTSKCAMCHGHDGVPKKMGAGSKAFGDPEFKKAATIEAILASIKDGKGKMKPVKSLSEAEAKAVAEYVLVIPAPK